MNEPKTKVPKTKAPFDFLAFDKGKIDWSQHGVMFKSPDSEKSFQEMIDAGYDLFSVGFDMGLVYMIFKRKK